MNHEKRNWSASGDRTKDDEKESFVLDPDQTHMLGAWAIQRWLPSIVSAREANESFAQDATYGNVAEIIDESTNDIENFFIELRYATQTTIQPLTRAAKFQHLLPDPLPELPEPLKEGETRFEGRTWALICASFNNLIRNKISGLSLGQILIDAGVYTDDAHNILDISQSIPKDLAEMGNAEGIKLTYKQGEGIKETFIPKKAGK